MIPDTFIATGKSGDSIIFVIGGDESILFFERQTFVFFSLEAEPQRK